LEPLVKGVRLFSVSLYWVVIMIVLGINDYFF